MEEAQKILNSLVGLPAAKPDAETIVPDIPDPSVTVVDVASATRIFARGDTGLPATAVSQPVQPQTAAPSAPAASSPASAVVDLNWDEATLDGTATESPAPPKPAMTPAPPKPASAPSPSPVAASPATPERPAVAPPSPAKPQPIPSAQAPAPSQSSPSTFISQPPAHSHDFTPPQPVEISYAPAAVSPEKPPQATLFSATMFPQSSSEPPAEETNPPLFAPMPALEVPNPAAASSTPAQPGAMTSNPPCAPRSASSHKRLLTIVAAGIALAALVGGGLYLALERQQRLAEQERLRQLAAAQAESAASRLERQQRDLIQQAQQLDAAKSYADALQKAETALKLNGPLEQDAQNLRSKIVSDASNEAAQAALNREDQLWNQALADFQQDRLDQAATEFQQVVAMDTAGHKAEAETYLKRRIPAARRTDKLFAQAQALINHPAGEQSLLRARRNLREVIRAGGPHAAEAKQLDSTISSKLVSLHTNQQRLRQLVGKFNSYDSPNPDDLRQLQAQFRGLESVDGPVANQAHDYAEVRIPREMQEIEREVNEPLPAPVAVKTPAHSEPSSSRRYLWVVSLDSNPPAQTWQGSLATGQKVAPAYVEGGVKIQSHPLPLHLVEQASRSNGQFRLRLAIDPQGHVSGGSVLSGDPSLGQQLLQAAEKDWQFAPPRVNSVPVTTSATVAVYF